MSEFYVLTQVNYDDIQNFPDTCLVLVLDHPMVPFAMFEARHTPSHWPGNRYYIVAGDGVGYEFSSIYAWQWWDRMDYLDRLNMLKAV